MYPSSSQRPRLSALSTHSKGKKNKFLFFHPTACAINKKYKFPPNSRGEGREEQPMSLQCRTHAFIHLVRAKFKNSMAKN